MGCGCSKNGNRNTSRGVSPSTQQNRAIVPQNNISQQSLTPLSNNKNTNSSDRRNIEKIRREAIRRALGR